MPDDELTVGIEEVEEMVRAACEILMRYVPEDRRDEARQEIMAHLERS